MEDQFLGMSWLTVGLLCLAVAGVYAVMSPRPLVEAARSGWSRMVLRWFHALVWVLLAGSFLVRGGYLPGDRVAANLLALGALICYGIFMIVMIRARRTSR